MSQEKDLDTSIAEEFTCPICLEILKDAQQLKCEHYFCRVCITVFLGHSSRSTYFCPIDQTPATISDIRSAPRPIRTILSTKQIKCRYQNCNERAILENLDQHELNCRFGLFCKSENRPSTSNTVPIDAPTVPINVVVKLADARTRIISCSVNESVLTFKRRIEDNVGIPADQQVLVFGSKTLENSKLLINYNIHNMCVMFTTQRFPGALSKTQISND